MSVLARNDFVLDTDVAKETTVLTEEDWTPDDLDTDKFGFYAIGKAQAEREAWAACKRMPGMLKRFCCCCCCCCCCCLLLYLEWR